MIVKINLNRGFYEYVRPSGLCNILILGIKKNFCSAEMPNHDPDSPDFKSIRNLSPLIIRKGFPNHLYFGKRTVLKKKIFRGKMFVPDQGANLELGITAYNSYGDLFNTSRGLHIYTNSKASNAGELVKIDEDWTQLLFKFHVHIER